jgi:alcohol dehydrogenase (NADP+)
MIILTNFFGIFRPRMMQVLNGLLLASLATAHVLPTTSPKSSQLDNIPILGLGTWQIRTNTSEVIAAAIQNGYRHIDCAYAYGNQPEIGIGIKEGLKRTGLSRKDLWITSKLWNSRSVYLCYL